MLFLQLHVCYRDTDWFRFTPRLSLSTPSFQGTAASWLRLLALEKMTIGRVNAEAIEWCCWTRIIRHLSYFSTSNVETEAVRLKRRGAEVIRHEVEKYWCCSLSVRLMTIVLFIISFFFALHSMPLCENLLEPRQNAMRRNIPTNLTPFLTI